MFTAMNMTIQVLWQRKMLDLVYILLFQWLKWKETGSNVLTTMDLNVSVHYPII